MKVQSVDHATLAQLAEAGALRGARAIGQPGGWALFVNFGSGERPLAAQRNRQVRVFKRMETLISYLKGVGISRFDVDSEGFVLQTAASHARPDRAQALRNAHRASAHDAWFRAQVQLALDEADAPEAEWISNEAVSADWAKEREALVERIAGGASD
jgi:hypothetical protein